ncbi:MAG: hypothetical protein D6755_01390 [Anaerolineae bacterium]|nr:MAG: hypothetical protein D6755_01390 [Anaerolineae bacterium]
MPQNVPTPTQGGETFPTEPSLTPQESMDQIESQVQELRGLDVLQPVERQLLTTEGLRRHVLENFLKDYTPAEAHDDVLTLHAFGFLPSDFDLIALYTALYTEQVAGFYDDEVKAMYVVQGEAFGGPERMTYAHEFTHALQDQHYDLRGNLKITDENCQQNSEYCAAVQSLVEGDATLVQEFWLTDYATSQDYSEIYEFYGTFQSPVYDSAPEYMQQDFLFPYQQGKDFVRFLYERGGWEMVDAAYQTLPQSTEQILHPERYPDDTPVAVTVPDVRALLPDGWRQVDEGVMGEWYTYLMLSYGRDGVARQSEGEAAAAAEGWGGDAYRVYVSPDEQQFALVFDTTWDTTRDANEFRHTLQRYISRRFNASTQNAGESAWAWEGEAGGYITLHQVDSRLVWLVAPDKATAEAMWQAIKSP